MVTEITLTKGKVALVDDGDYERVSRCKWYYGSDGAAKTTVRIPGGKKCVLMHRFILDAPPDMQVDHINHDRTDNRRCNLRLATSRQNHMNMRKHKGVSRFKGLSKRKASWQAAIRTDEGTIYLGAYGNELEAAIAYDHACRKEFGPFALPNFPDTVFRALWAVYGPAILQTQGGMKKRPRRSAA